MHNVALFRCEDCEIFFKSKKGYEGHLANKHAPKLIGSDGLAKSKKEVEGLNKVKTIEMLNNKDRDTSKKPSTVLLMQNVDGVPIG